MSDEIECKIIKIDEARMNIVVSRRRLLEEEREAKKKELLERLFSPDSPTIGEALAQSQTAMIADWKKDPVAALAKPLVGVITTR
mgnify:CR=1 FL=1